MSCFNFRGKPGRQVCSHGRPATFQEVGSCRPATSAEEEVQQTAARRSAIAQHGRTYMAATMGGENVTLVFKLYCLTVMTLVAAAYTVALRYTRTTVSPEELYFTTTAVCITEVIKLILSTGMLAWECGSVKNLLATIKEHLLNNPRELLKLSVPSLVYALQNNMAFVALSNLDAAVYQVTYQLKIPCTAVCMVIMLGRSLSKKQWFAISTLCLGVMLVRWKPVDATKVQIEQNPFLGFMAIVIAVLCSGFAGVYFEKVLKSSNTSLWLKNIQMYLSGILITLIAVGVNDGDKVVKKGFFFGYTPWVCCVVFLASVGGLYTSVVVKYTDNIMKGFSAAAAIVLSTVASVILFGLHITTTFSSGAFLVCVSIYLYGLPNKDTSTLNQEIAHTESQKKLIVV
ncbi:CMP-sialic acid transporter [Syngnathoides biaculeatus]|uniref:CMP-sialic acid transporter n=1 Tax=Syngnathoides biaculeatus TaxID=300417 RepID=UPI002ADE5BD6|nr:CMP-sialic acid transporter [Syngnathoides biaculeatus]XP_061667724.1 CMP-sialic acid transporter [Syngnathoides biaculeatus]